MLQVFCCGVGGFACSVQYDKSLLQFEGEVAYIREHPPGKKEKKDKVPGYCVLACSCWADWLSMLIELVESELDG